VIDLDAINTLAEQIHQAHHLGSCADIHPIVHADQLKGFHAKAMQEMR